MRAGARVFSPIFQAFALRAIGLGGGLRQGANERHYARQISLGMGAQKHLDIKRPIRQIHGLSDFFQSRSYRFIGGKLVAIIENIPRQLRHRIFGEVTRKPRD